MRILTSGLIVGLLILALYLIWTWDDARQPAGQRIGVEEKPMILRNPELSDFEDNRLKMRINAEVARVFEERKLTLLETIDGRFYSKTAQEEPTRILADAGHIRGQTEQMTVWGNVRVFFRDGQILYTERMTLDQKKETLYNTVPVRVVSESDRVKADRMHYSIQSGVLVLTRPRAWIDAGGRN